MKKNNEIISPNEQKKLLVEMLKYIDTICRKNNIKYSLFGGTLIGAIRHKGFIPWDDDIDIILDKDNYDRLIEILKNENNKNYKVFLPGLTKNYVYSFAKLINVNTSLEEEILYSQVEDYGLFLDIFYFGNIPDDLKGRKKFYKKLFFLKNLIKIRLDYGNPSFFKVVGRLCKNIFIDIFGYEYIQNKIKKHFDSYYNCETKCVICNHPIYGIEKDVQKKENIQDYIDVKFEGITAMAFKNYDEILRTCYGDYMILPPVEKRTTHNLTVYRKK